MRTFILISTALVSLTAVSAFILLSPCPRFGAIARGPRVMLFAGGPSTVVSEAERLLAKARELREEAQRAEEKVHADLAQKKAEKDAQTDAFIDYLFSGSGKGLVDRLRHKRPSLDTLEQTVDRLDEREVIASGNEHVESKTGDRSDFIRVAKKDEVELQKLKGWIDQLIAAVKVLDTEFLEEAAAKGNAHASHAEESHFGGGKAAERLGNRVLEIRRERDEQWQERIEDFYEAQRIHKTREPKKKVEDDEKDDESGGNSYWDNFRF